MALFKKLAILAVAAAALVESAPVSESATPTAKPVLVRRDQAVLTDAIWTSTSSGVAFKVTPTVLDGVTISASPVTDSATPWVSLDNSGIPTGITPTVSGSSTISASPTPTEADYPDATGVPPVLRCFGDRVPSESTLGYPFCTALNGSEWLVGETYWVTWDPTYWGGSDITRVKLAMLAYPIKDDADPIFTSDYVNNNNGYYPLEMLSSYVQQGGYFYLQITPLASPGSTATHVGSKTGPLLRVIKSKSDAITTISRVPSDNGVDAGSTSSKSSSSKAKIIAPAVVVPVVVVFAIALGVIYYLKTRKPSTEGGPVFGSTIRLKRTGYGEGSKAQRTGTTVETANAVESETDNDANSVTTAEGASSLNTEAMELENPFRNVE